MAYLKFKADAIFTGTEMLRNDVVLITQEDGTIENIVAANDAGDGIQQSAGILTPGFINAHCHTELSHMKGLIPERTGLIDFVFSIVGLRHFEEGIILEAIQNAETEMLQNGIVAVGDICNTTHSIQQKKQSKLNWYNFIEISGWLPQVAEKRFEQMREMNAQFSMLNAQNSIVPHAPYSVSNKLWNLIKEEFPGKTISIHNQETLAEDELFKDGTGDFNRMYSMMNIRNADFQPSGKSSVQTYFSNMDKAKSTILVHNTFTTKEDIDFIQNSSFTSHHASYFCLCPNANLYIENTLPNIEMLRTNNVNIVLGTDSLASNRSLNIAAEIQTIRKNFPSIPLAEILQWATLNGAKALQMDDTLGSFEKGKKSGVVLFTDAEVKRLL
jgi:cytosine/adenosine deaminase-related metal-dependent hydrolase